MERAYTRIEKGIVRLGNEWLERRWNSFLGTTVELLRVPARADALARRSPEFHLDLGGRPIAAPDLGDPQWSEACDRHGATITMALSEPGLAVEVDTLLFHQVPAMLRTLSVTNTSAEPVELTRAAPDVLPLDPGQYRSGNTAGSPEIYARMGGKPLHYAAIRSTGETVLLGASREIQFALFDPNPVYCAPVWAGSVMIPPGKTWQAPPVALLWVFGDVSADTTGAVAGLHRVWEARDADRAPSGSARK